MGTLTVGNARAVGARGARILGTFLLSAVNTVSAFSPAILGVGVALTSTEPAPIEGAVLVADTEAVSEASIEELFADTASAGVIAVGVSEGTMNADGSKTRYYDGHVDPGNSKWNQGFGSCQVAACQGKPASEVERYLLARTGNTAKAVAARNPEWKLGWVVAAVDLEIQAPLAVPGFEKALNEKIAAGQEIGVEEIVDARVKGFYNPKTGKLEASGLGNSLSRLTADQRRRVEGQWVVLEQSFNLKGSYAGVVCNIIIGECWIPDSSGGGK